MAPAWSELGKSFDNDSDVVIAHVDCTKAKNVCSNAKVSHSFRGIYGLLLPTSAHLVISCRLVAILHLSSSMMARSKNLTEVMLASPCCAQYANTEDMAHLTQS